MDGKAILDLPMQKNDANAKTVRDYLKALLKKLWVEEERFGGKRPFGNSGWQTHDLGRTFIKARLIDGTLDEDGYVETCDDKALQRAVLAAIEVL